MSLSADAAQTIAFKNTVKAARDAATAIINDPDSASQTQLVSEAEQTKAALDPIVHDLEVMSQTLTDMSQKYPSA